MTSQQQHYLPDAIPNPHDLQTLFRLAEGGYWVAFDSYLAREGILAADTLSADEVRQMIRRCVGADRHFTCALCERQTTGWGHNPAPIVCDEGRRCCLACNDSRVIPQRIRDATSALGRVMAGGHQQQQ